LLSAASIAVALYLALAVAAPAQVSSQLPINDNYLGSLNLNQPHPPLNRIDTLTDTRNISTATVQSDIFSPPQQGGPREVTGCSGVSEAKTIWYDFYPDADGLVSIRTSGFDNVITLYRFSRSSLLPDVAGRQCVHQNGFPSEQLVAHVRKGLAYTFQIGGVLDSTGIAAGGPLEMKFDYSVIPPRSLRADATLTARATSTGISIIGLTVSAPHRGARVEVDCPQHCRSQIRTVPKHGPTTLGFRGLAGLSLPKGAQIVIRVSAPHMIGAAIRYGVLAGNLTKNQFCTEPGSRKLRRTCH